MPITQQCMGIVYTMRNNLVIEWNPALGSASIPSTTGVRTVVEVGTAAWSSRQNPFSGAYEFIAPHYDGSGSPPSGTSIVQGTANYTPGQVVSSGDTSGITSTGLFAGVLNLNGSIAIIINPQGPGVSGDGGTTQDFTMDAYS